MEIVRTSKINSQISKATLSTATRAYQCTMEQLSAHWCAARDAKNIAKFMNKGVSNTRFNNGALEALRLLEDELPDIVKWLERVRVASEPANVAAARQQATARQGAHLSRRRRPGVQGRCARGHTDLDGGDRHGHGRCKSRHHRWSQPQGEDRRHRYPDVERRDPRHRQGVAARALKSSGDYENNFERAAARISTTAGWVILRSAEIA